MTAQQTSTRIKMLEIDVPCDQRLWHIIENNPQACPPTIMQNNASIPGSRCANVDKSYTLIVYNAMAVTARPSWSACSID
jgi:hypothetical protein